MSLHALKQEFTTLPNDFTCNNSTSSVATGSSDVQLWQEFQLGNEDAYAAIYKNHVSQLYMYGLKIVNNTPLVKDCVQDLFIEIWNNRDNLGEVRHIRSYLFTAIRRKVIAEAKRRRLKAGDLNPKDVIHISSGETFERKLIEKQNFDEQSSRLKNALTKITEKQREAIHLKYRAQLSYDEITNVMGLSKKGAYKLIDRAIKGLRKHM